MAQFEKILDSAVGETGWNLDSQRQILMEFLESHCPEKMEQFQAFIDDKVDFEFQSESPEY